MRQAAAGRTGQEQAAWVPAARPPRPQPRACPEKQARPAAGGAALREVHANLRDPQGFLEEPRRAPACPCRSSCSRRGLQGRPERTSRGFGKVGPISAPGCIPKLFSVSCPLHASSESRPTSACMLSAEVRTGESWSESRRASRLKKDGT